MSATNFGDPDGFKGEQFVANYKGPLLVLKQRGTTITLTATHEDPNATLGLTYSAQMLDLDTSANPPRVDGIASFFTAAAAEVLECKFNGVVLPGPKEPDKQRAFVQVVFTGGTGRFEHASGVGFVEADLFPSRGYSEGTIKANVFTP